jgi:cell volume regulation protein A
VGKLAVVAFRRLRLHSNGIYPVASLAVAALAYGTADSLHGSAFLAVYLTGLLLGDTMIPGRQTIAVFHDGVAWVAQVGLFLTLGLLVSPSRLGAVAPEGVALALVVVLIARPLATMVATTGESFSLPERAVLAWAGMRGAVPVVFATLPAAAGVRGSDALFDIVFLVVVVSTLLQGLTFQPLARGVGLTSSAPPLPRPLVEFGGSRRLGGELVEYPVTADDGAVGRRLRDLQFPLGSMVVVIVRDGQAVPATDSTRVNAGDMLHILVRQEVAGRIPELVELCVIPFRGAVRQPSDGLGDQHEGDEDEHDDDDADGPPQPPLLHGCVVARVGRRPRVPRRTQHTAQGA